VITGLVLVACVLGAFLSAAQEPGVGPELNVPPHPDVLNTDGDGLSDPDEASYGSNPNNVDSDGDWLWDGEELGYRTSRTNADTDGDRISDWQEIRNGSDPTTSDLPTLPDAPDDIEPGGGPGAEPFPDPDLCDVFPDACEPRVEAEDE